jgi:hypothetical protein
MNLGMNEGEKFVMGRYTKSRDFCKPLVKIASSVKIGWEIQNSKVKSQKEATRFDF